MTHKSLLAPPVCHVSAHNNYIKCFYKLSWHELFVTSGQHRGSADLAEPQCVVFPGWEGESHTNSFCMGLSGTPGIARWVWMGPGSLFAVGGLGHGPKPENAITIAVSSRALFRMEEEQKIYNEQGVEAYVKYQLDHENEPFLPGAAFPFVKALEAVNTQLRELYPDSEELFDIVLMTNNHAQVGVRLINSINHYDLFIERFCMTGGNSPICYLKAYHTNLYLSSDAEKVSGAIEEGIAAATIFSPSKDLEVSENQLRVAFDGDAVLFSDESEQIVKAHGLDMFFEHEKAHENKPLAQGPLKGFLEALGKLQKKFYSKGLRMECPIRTYLVTARSAASSGARALKTLRSWGLETDEALFLAGAPKGPLLKKIRPHIFFDDQMFHVEGAKEMGTVAAHVPYGIAQKHKRPAQEKQTPNSK
uniref:5'-nucleotidase, cytosolic IA n=11 Tax=Neoaves TaxID=3078114 RepID=A0A8C0F9E3_BUBBB